MDKHIFTGNYENCKIGNIVSISGDRGKSVGFTQEALPCLAPKMSFWKVWHNNIGKIKEEENTRYYIYEFYHQVLKGLDPELILENLTDDTILLCYEENLDFCHRHLVAFWFELFLGVKTSEVKIEKDTGKIIELERPEYLKEELESVIKEDYPMHHFNSVRAAYLFNQAETLEKGNWAKLKRTPGLINELPELWGWEVAGLRIMAEEEEEKYQKEVMRNEKNLTKKNNLNTRTIRK